MKKILMVLAVAICAGCESIEKMCAGVDAYGVHASACVYPAHTNAVALPGMSYTNKP